MGPRRLGSHTGPSPHRRTPTSFLQPAHGDGRKLCQRQAGNSSLSRALAGVRRSVFPRLGVSASTSRTNSSHRAHSSSTTLADGWTTGFTPFELLFGRQPRELLEVAKEAWEHQHPTPHHSLIKHVTEMRERIDRVAPLVREHMVKAQQAQQRHYNRAAQPREFQRGDRVMVLVPTAA